MFFPFKFALFLLFLLLRTIRKQKIRNKQFWKYSSDYKRTWRNDNCILCSLSSLSEENPIHLLFYPGWSGCSRRVSGGFVKDVIVLIKASIKLIRLSHIPTLYGSIPLEKCEIHVNMKCIVCCYKGYDAARH